MKHFTALLLLLDSINVRAQNCGRVIRQNDQCCDLNTDRKRTSECRNLCSFTNCEIYWCCIAQNAQRCPRTGDDRISYCNNIGYQNIYPWTCSQYFGFDICDWDSQLCCPNQGLITSKPTASPTLGKPKVNSIVDCSCSPQEYKVTLFNYEGFFNDPVDLRNLCGNNPLLSADGIKPGLDYLRDNLFNDQFSCQVLTGTYGNFGNFVPDTDTGGTRPAVFISFDGTRNNNNSFEARECYLDLEDTTVECNGLFGCIAQVAGNNSPPLTCNGRVRTRRTGSNLVPGQEITPESEAAKHLKEGICLKEQQTKNVVTAASISLQGVYQTQLGGTDRAIQINLHWEYTNTCAPVPFAQEVKFWEAEFGSPLLKIGQNIGPDEEWCSEAVCSGGCGECIISPEVGTASTLEELEANPEEPEADPEEPEAVLEVDCESLTKKSCKRSDECTWENDTCSSSTGGDLSSLSSAVKEAEAVAKPNSSIVTTASAWGIMTAVVTMWYVA